MLPSGSWLHIIVGFLVGISSTVFVYTTRRLVKQYSSIRKIVLCLTLYVSTIVFVLYLYGVALSGGFLTEWQSLGRPAFGDRALELIDIGYVLAQSGNRYQFLHRNDRDGNWEIVQEMVDEDLYLSTYPMEDCRTLFFLPFPLGNVVDSKAVCMYTGHSTVKVVYAIDNDGYVYLWQHHSEGAYQEIIAEFFSPLETGIASCVFGIAMILLFAALASLQHRRSNTR
jgi:hypothetical protein